MTGDKKWFSSLIPLSHKEYVTFGYDKKDKVLGTDIESVSRPPSGFWCLNDKTIKELMTFAKCETGKMSYKSN
jgi:hypothetical protein